MRIPDKLLPPFARAPAADAGRAASMLMHQKTVHSSLDNETNDQVRLSFDLRYQPIGQPTGRRCLPRFRRPQRRPPGVGAARSAGWARLWLDTRAARRAEEAERFSRWNSDSPVCA